MLYINTSWKHLAPGGGGRGPSTNYFTGRLRPEVQPLVILSAVLTKSINQSINQSFSLTRYVEELENSFKIRTCKKKASLDVNASPLKYKKKWLYLMLMLNLYTLLAQLKNRRQTVATEFFINTE